MQCLATALSENRREKGVIETLNNPRRRRSPCFCVAVALVVAGLKDIEACEGFGKHGLHFFWRRWNWRNAKAGSNYGATNVPLHGGGETEIKSMLRPYRIDVAAAVQVKDFRCTKALQLFSREFRQPLIAVIEEGEPLLKGLPKVLGALALIFAEFVGQVNAWITIGEEIDHYVFPIAGEGDFVLHRFAKKLYPLPGNQLVAKIGRACASVQIVHLIPLILNKQSRYHDEPGNPIAREITMTRRITAAPQPREPAKVLPFIPRPKPEPKKETLLDQLERQLFDDSNP